MLKLFTRRGYVKLDDDVAALERAIEYLKQPKRERQTRAVKDRVSKGVAGPSGADLHDINGQKPESSDEGRAV